MIASGLTDTEHSSIPPSVAVVDPKTNKFLGLVRRDQIGKRLQSFITTVFSWVTDAVIIIREYSRPVGVWGL